MPRLFYPPLVEPGVYVKPKGIQSNEPGGQKSSRLLLSTAKRWLPPSAVPHISQSPVPKSRGLTASPRGEKPLYDKRYSSFYCTRFKLPPKASPLREKLSKIGSSEPIFD